MSGASASGSGGSLESTSALMLAAAHELYIGSARTPADWAEFLDTMRHAMEPLRHHAPADHMCVAGGGGVTLPKNGVHGANAAGAALNLSPTILQFEAVLEELYLTQGYTNTHHARVAEKALAGAALTLPVGKRPTPTLTNHRFLSETCYQSLRDLFRVGDPVLEAIFIEYRDAGGANNARAYADFLHSIITLSQRWKRYVFFDYSRKNHIHVAQVFFGILEDFIMQRLITYGEYEFLENMLYTLTVGHHLEPNSSAAFGRHASDFLMAAWLNLYELITDGTDPLVPAIQMRNASAVEDFYDSLLHLLDSQMDLIISRYESEARSFLNKLQSYYNPQAAAQFSPAAFLYLHSLIEHQIAYTGKKRRGQLTRVGASSSDDDVASTQKDRASTLLFSCFAESATTQNVDELISTLRLIGNNWRKHTPHAELLNCLRYCEEQSLLTHTDFEVLERLVFVEHDYLCVAWELYEASGYTVAGFDEFIDNTRVVIEHEFRATQRRRVKEGYKLINTIAGNPDPEPVFHSDPLRNEALGIARFVPREVDSAQSTRAYTSEPEFMLPVSVNYRLSVAHTELVRSLLANRDVVLLALLSEYNTACGSGEYNEALSEFIDSLERLIAREEYGTAAAAATQRARRGSTAAGAAGPSGRTAANAEQQLDIYQLSQMLISLQGDGYLSYTTLLQLLHAVQEQQDPVLLAAFSIYKEGISSAQGSTAELENKYWPEMWDTLQRVWPRIQNASLASANAARANDAAGAMSYLHVQDALILRHIGAEIIDSMSTQLSIVQTIYLRDLLRSGDPVLYAILSLAQEGVVNSEEEVQQSIVHLANRWMRQGTQQQQTCCKLLQALHNAKFFSASSLDYLLSLVYGGDVTLHAAHDLYTSTAAAHEVLDDEDDSDFGGGGYSSDDDSDASWEVIDMDEFKYGGGGHAKSARASARRANGAATRANHVSRGLDEFLDTLRHILASGARTIDSLNAASGGAGGAHSALEQEYDAFAAADEVQPMSKNPQEYGLPYYEQ